MSRVFLDLDGVIVSMVEPLLRLHGSQLKEHHCQSYDISKLLNISIQELWEPADYNFWVSLPKYDYADRLLRKLEPLHAVILTSPTWHMAGAKQDWIHQNMPNYFHEGRYLIGPGKEFISCEGKYLIDDYEKNVDRWKGMGGKALLFPKPWNRNRHLVGLEVEHVGYMLDSWGLI